MKYEDERNKAAKSYPGAFATFCAGADWLQNKEIKMKDQTNKSVEKLSSLMDWAIIGFWIFVFDELIHVIFDYFIKTN